MMISSKKTKRDYSIIFTKLKEAQDVNDDDNRVELISDSNEINELREIVLDVSEENEKEFSST